MDWQDRDRKWLLCFIHAVNIDFSDPIPDQQFFLDPSIVFYSFSNILSSVSGIDIKDIPNVNDRDFSVTLNGFFLVRWRDPRLIIDNVDFGDNEPLIPVDVSLVSGYNNLIQIFRTRVWGQFWPDTAFGHQFMFCVSPNSVSHPLWDVCLNFLSVTSYWQKIIEGGWQTDSLSHRHTCNFV